MKLSIEPCLDLLFPCICRNCGDRFRGGLSNILCGPCFDSIQPFEEPVCGHCGVPLPPGAFEGSVGLRCVDCGDGDYFLDSVRAYGSYEGPLRQAHHFFKFEGMESLAGPIGERMAAALPQAFLEGLGALVPVPLSSERLRERGYNPSALLAGRISLKCGTPVLDALRKTRPTQPQMTLSREERFRNPRGAYEAVGKMPWSVLLVDDVFTTGGTLEECARVLKKAGVKWVGAVVFGRTPHQLKG